MAKRITFKLYEHEIVLAEQFAAALQVDLNTVAKKALMFSIYTAYEEGKRKNAEATSGIPTGTSEETTQSEANDPTTLADSQENRNSDSGY